MLQSNLKWAIVAYYQFNKAYIANTLCENKAQPKLNCNGKCYLNKKLKEQERQEQKTQSLLKSVEYMAASNFSFTVPTVEAVCGKLAQPQFTYSIAFYQSPDLAVFQPPQI